MNEQSWMCALCTRVKATCFCCCEDREVLLCEGCFFAHYKKNPLQVHIPVPASAFGQHKNPRYLEHLQSRSARIPRAKAEVLKNIDTIDLCIAKLQKAIKGIVTQLNELGSRVIRQLQERKSVLQREINDGIAEVERTMFEHSPAFKTKWANLIRNFQGDQSSLVCFTYSIDTKKVLEALKSICTFTNDDPDPREVVVGIRKEQLTIFDPTYSRIQQISHPLAFQSSPQLCVLQGNQVLALGPKEGSKRAFLISLSSGEVKETCKMTSGRSLPGMICVASTVYVLGGGISEAEKYLVSEFTWQRMPSATNYMDHPVLCYYKKRIYVFEYFMVKSFNIEKETIEKVKVQFGCNDVYLACAVDDHIMIMTDSADIYWWKPGEGNPEMQTKEKVCGEIATSQCQPVVRGRKVFFASPATGNIKCLDIDFRVVKRV